MNNFQSSVTVFFFYIPFCVQHLPHSNFLIMLNRWSLSVRPLLCPQFSLHQLHLTSLFWLVPLPSIIPSLLLLFLSPLLLLLPCSPLSLLASQPGKVFFIPVKNFLPNESPHSELSMNDGSALIQTPVRESC